MGESGEHRAASDAAQLVELRVTLAQTGAEVHRLRSDLAPLAALPVQLDALSRLWQEQLDNVKESTRRDIADVRADVDELRSWHTWVVRIVIGFVVLAALAVVIQSGPTS